jgi:hypothetical protein
LKKGWIASTEEAEKRHPKECINKPVPGRLVVEVGSGIVPPRKR